MTTSTFKIAFEIVAEDRARVFLNDNFMGNIRIHDVLSKGQCAPRLTYRDSSSPFKNLIQTASYCDLKTESVESLLKDPHVYRRVCAAILRSALYNNAPVEIPLHVAT